MEGISSSPRSVRSAPARWPVAFVAAAGVIAVWGSALTWGFYDLYGGGGWYRGAAPGAVLAVLSLVVCLPALAQRDRPEWVRRLVVAVVVLALVGPLVAGLVARTPV